MTPGVGLLRGPWRLSRAVASGAMHVVNARRHGTRPTSWAAAITRETLLRLGPVPTKFGQILGSRVDLVGDAWRAELALLHDRVPVPARTSPDLGGHGLSAHALATLHLTGGWLGAGSVAVVYRGSLDGRPVAAKILRPGVAKAMTSDLATLVAISSLIARIPALRVLPIHEVASQVADIVGAQVNLLDEADQLVRLGAVASRWGIEVPQPLFSHTTCSVLTTPLIEGLDVANWELLDPVVRIRYVEATMNFVYDALFNHGIVHADLHPGNLYATPAGVVVLDGGMVFALSEHARRSFLAFFLSFATGDGASCGEIVWHLSERPPGSEERKEPFLHEMSALIRGHHGRQASDFSLITFSREFFNLQRRFGLRSSPEFALPVLALLVVEGTVREHAPRLEFQSLAVPHLLRATFSLEPNEQYGEGIWATSS